MNITIQTANQTDRHVRDHILATWNEACGRALAISPYMVEYNTSPATDISQAAWLALVDGKPAGFALASMWSQSPSAGWIDAVAVAPAYQRRGAGTALLAAAEEWLRDQGCERARFGGSMRPFVPGLPLELERETFFRQRGYEGDRVEIDVARDLSGYSTPVGVARTSAVRPLEQDEIPQLHEFFARAFPGRWQYEAAEHFAAGGRACDFLVLWHAGRIEGFCYITTAGSLRPLDRFFPNRLPLPWGQVGPLGVSRDVRGQGYGVSMIDATLRHLHNRGTAGCVIDWTTLTELYGKFGFEPYRRYAALAKDLTA